MAKGWNYPQSSKLCQGHANLKNDVLWDEPTAQCPSNLHNSMTLHTLNTTPSTYRPKSFAVYVTYLLLFFYSSQLHTAQ